MQRELKAPSAKKIGKQLIKHNDVRIDDYYWLNERENPEVIAYLGRENAYFEDMTSHTLELRESLFQEMKSRIREDDSSVPYKFNGYWYATRYEVGKEYPIFTRRFEKEDAEEEIMFNCNIMAEGFDYFNLGGLSISPNNELAAFGVDTVSRRQYTLQIKNLGTHEIYADKIENTTGSAVWANDNKTLFYTKKDPVTLRSNNVYRHVLGTAPEEDELVFHEEDETFTTFVYKTKSKEFIVIGSSSTLTTEFQILRADDPKGKFHVFSKRIRGMEYSLTHYEDNFYILTNMEGATNFKLMTTPEDQTESEHWVDFIPHREEVLLEDIEMFNEYYVLSERENGLNKLKIVRWDTGESYYLPFDNETYTAYVGTNPDFDTQILRYGYNSMTTPSSIIDFNMGTKEKVIKKEQEVLGGKFEKENYVSERIWAPARDGNKIPISLVYHKNTKLDGSCPLLQYGYGSYGHTIDPYFSTVRLSLLDRGFVYAIAHVRGGEYLGRKWYEEGRLLNKMNTFTDFIDCSKYLIERKYTSAEHLYASGGSAGGLLMGAIVNLCPEIYHGVIAAVPFVDVLTTMLDDTIPLTTGEYDEWGNPNEKEYYDYMKSYSPYDNVSRQLQPHMLVITGFHDSQVQYFEPAKWVAKLREYKMDNNLLLFNINMDAGHGGASGRFESLREVAKEYAFLLDLEHKIR
ncbi:MULTISPECIES: S9 family peptidase [unclassified Arenibacter]|uniref:S9 family peptidase n=1 Tax=unclassified Arenibacter TaxID=2615047 RepID=UPI000E343949|nr:MULTISPECIES: S9 family peptidase [unclassified Arenibacter]MCM4163297.1 oligopeptidase B [Arenibacter sp. A80]RFT57312.1 S9 family peptidase [Arenibacter sp. P308M17]